MEIFVVFFYFLVFQSQIVAVNVALENRSLLENGPEVVSISSESNNVSTSNESSLNVLNFQKSKAPIIPSNIDDLQVKEQVVSEPFVSSGSQKPASETASVKPDHEVVKGSILTELPSLDSVAAEGINTHEIPTFNEFHAMVSEGTQSRKGQATEFGEDRIANSQYDLETEKGAKNAPDQTLEKVSHAHTDSNPIKISNTQGMHEAAIDDTISADGVSLPSDNGKPDSHLELQRQSLKVNSNLLPDMEMNSKGNSHVTPQPIITTTITDEAIHTPSKIDVTLRRNVAAVACGAKMLGSSKAIKNPEAVLNENNDEYMNVPCSEEKWLILEVCQPVQLRTIELANFELFSSRLKSFRVYASDRYPAKSWELIGTFAARDVKGIQSFSVTSGKMIKYVKFELTEHYGSEHYCPLTMIRIFGLGSDDLDDDDDDDDAVEVGVMNIPVTGNREPVIVVTNVKDQPLSSDHFPNVESEAVKLDNKTDEGFESTNTRMDDIHSASDPSISSQPTEDDSHIPSFNNEINTNLLYNHTKSINSEYVAPFLPLSTPEHNPNAVQNQADMNMDSSSDHSAMFSADTSASSPHIQHKGAVDSSKGVKNLHLSKETNSGFCRNDKLFQLLKDKPYCPVTFHCDYYYSNHGKHCAPNCQTTKLSNPAVLASQKPHIPKATTKTTPKVPVVALNHGVVSILSKNRTATNRSLQLHNKPFSPRVDEMNIFSRLINAVKNAVFNAISPFFSSIYDFSTDYDSSSYDVVPKLEHYLAVGYLFTQQGFSDPLCKDSLIYLKTDQIEGLWHLRTCLLLLNKIYAGGNTQSSNTAYTLLSWEDAAAASRLNECHQAAKQLNLTLSLHSHLSGYEISKSIMHMFIAYQNVKRNKALNRSKAIGSDSFYWNFLYDDVHNSDDYIMSCQPLDWKFQQLNTILWNGIIHKCSKLPLFLLSSVYSSSPPFTSDPVHTNDVDDNDEKMLVTNFHSSDDIVIGMNLKSSDHRLKTRKIDRQHSSNEALVVPASLGGSQGATAYMRLSNRVRIIERNVSVSMRYLEELSQSYRRQMERLSRSFNLTYAWLKLTASGAEERDRQQQTFSLVCLHLILASITHLFIYWTWLRPQNHKITFDTELFLSSLYRTLCSNKSHQNLSNIVIYFNPCHTRKTQATNNRLVTTSPLPPSPTDDCVTHEVEQDENNEQNRGESLGKASISNHTVSACCQLDNFLQCCRCKPSLSASSSSTVLIGGNSTDDFIQTDVIGNNYALEENTKTANNDDHSTELHDSGVINHKFSDICGITLIHHAHNCKVGMHLCDSKKDLKISSNFNLVSDNNSPSVDCINVALPGQPILSKQCNRHRQFLSLPELPTTSQLDHLKLESVISKCDEDYGMESVCQLRHNELMICPNSLSSMQTNASSSFSLTPPLSLCDHIGTTNSNDVNDGSHLHDKTLGLTANHHQSAENSISTWTSTFHKRNTRPNKRRRKRLSEINDSLCKF
ncbi:unnamed protein product [Heterobilharzia americana]|nr:unnamed protein product [Heterobilharzia americana]